MQMNAFSYRVQSFVTRSIRGKEMTQRHVPVMTTEVLRYLLHDSTRIVVDATLGAGGHAEAILSEHDSRTLIGMDRDPTALELAARRLSCFGHRFRPVHASFSDIATALAGTGPADAVFADLGVSSMQIDDAGRGFSYRADGPLDMRMASEGETAAEFISRSSVDDIARVLGRYGEVRRPRRLARAIKGAADADGLSATSDMLRVVRETFGDAAPALLSRVFQAFRIAVNGELDQLEAFLPAALDVLAPNGRLVVISYHSLEDRLVKNFFRDMSARCVCPPEIPICVCSSSPRVEVLTRRVLTPAADEVFDNVRARSAKLRAVRVLRAGGVH